MKTRELELYLHIPFCKKKCSYCDFCSFPAGDDEISSYIRKLRQELQMTQEELAQRCRVSRQTIISLEKGKYDPSIHLAHRIATIFQHHIEDVFLFTEGADES